MNLELNKIYNGDALEILKTFPDQAFDCCITSPPYYGLRDYGVDGQIGLENTPEEYVEKLVEVFQEVKRVLKDDGTLWLNLGDSYAGNGMGAANYPSSSGKKQISNQGSTTVEGRGGIVPNGLKQKDLMGIPWMVAFALRSDGWYLRQDIIWAKPNPMPESVTDRCTKSHEYIFLLSKSPRYYFNAEAIMEPIAGSTIERMKQNVGAQAGSNRVPGKTNGPMKAVLAKGNARSFRGGGVYTRGQSFNNSLYTDRETHENIPNESGLRNRRSVWTVATAQCKEAHFATFPPNLIEPCILAGCPESGIVLDTFFGSGTVGEVSISNNRNFVGIDIKKSYCDMAKRRINGTAYQYRLTEDKKEEQK